ncbi:MAG: UDP-N-acetylmuramoyl-L-alanyl-D-glutamate--2,6-diaminopimelate ligase [Candidatus Omnitrophota bacterium]
MKLTRLIKSLEGCNVNYHLADFEVKGISADSKGIREGFVFVAIRGSGADGNAFIDEAIKNGAGAVVVAASELTARNLYKAPVVTVSDPRKALAMLAVEFYGNPGQKIKIAGITGTNGKTTISYLLEALLKKSGKNPAVIGTINYRFKDKLIPAKNTTPGPVELQSMLAQMLEEKVDYAVMEVSSHALDQDRALGIPFHSALFTNLTQDHLDYHKTLEDYFQAKARLFTGLAKDSFAVINTDDPYGRRLAAMTEAKVISYGIDQPADIMAQDIKFDISHTEFTLDAAGQSIKLKSRLIGRHNVYNLLACAGWAVNAGFSLKILQSALEDFSCVPGRLEPVQTNRGFSVFVDYAHTDDALNNVIRTLRQVAQGKIIVVFGCGGDRDRLKRPRMGAIAAQLADYAVITSDNPRSEDPLEIIKEIKEGITKDNYCVVADRMEAIKKALSIASNGDIVLIAGKGHENYQVIKDKVLQFDDREAVKKCLGLMRS